MARYAILQEDGTQRWKQVVGVDGFITDPQVALSTAQGLVTLGRNLCVVKVVKRLSADKTVSVEDEQ